MIMDATSIPPSHCTTTTAAATTTTTVTVATTTTSDGHSTLFPISPFAPPF